MIEYILRNLENNLTKKVKSQGQSIDFDQMLTLCKITEEKVDKIITKIRYSETREKMKIFDKQELELLWFIKNQWSEKSRIEHLDQNLQID